MSGRNEGSFWTSLDLSVSSVKIKAKDDELIKTQPNEHIFGGIYTLQWEQTPLYLGIYGANEYIMRIIHYPKNPLYAAYTTTPPLIKSKKLTSIKTASAKKALPISKTQTFMAHIQQESIAKNPLSDECAREIQAYLNGQLYRFEIPFLAQGSAFMLRVWEALGEIAYGEVKSYKDIAEAINAPFAFRAVGNANHKNPLPLLIPCHRVLRNNGALGGYALGESFKAKLLAMEAKISRTFTPPTHRL